VQTIVRDDIAPAIDEVVPLADAVAAAQRVAAGAQFGKVVVRVGA